LIGPGGKMIRKIIQETGAEIEVQDDGTVKVASRNSDSAKAALDRIHAITQDAEIGKAYSGTIKRIMNFGAFCEILPGKEGLIHVSELSDEFVENVEDVVHVGDKVEVKVMEIDSQGRVNLTMKKNSSGPGASRPSERRPRPRSRHESGKGFHSKKSRRF